MFVFAVFFDIIRLLADLIDHLGKDDLVFHDLSAGMGIALLE